MRGVVNFGKSTLLAILLAAPIGNTTILLLFSLSLETLLALHPPNAEEFGHLTVVFNQLDSSPRKS